MALTPSLIFKVLSITQHSLHCWPFVIQDTSKIWVHCSQHWGHGAGVEKQVEQNVSKIGFLQPSRQHCNNIPVSICKHESVTLQCSYCNLQQQFPAVKISQHCAVSNIQNYLYFHSCFVYLEPLILMVEKWILFVKVGKTSSTGL